MKGIKFGFMIGVLVLVILGCSGKKEAEDSITVKLIADKSTILADNKETVNFNVEILDKEDNLLDGLATKIYINGKEQTTMTFKTDEPAIYKVQAENGGVKSNQLSITAKGIPYLVKVGSLAHLWLINPSYIENLKIDGVEYPLSLYITKAFEITGGTHNFQWTSYEESLFGLIRENEKKHNFNFKVTEGGTILLLQTGPEYLW